MCVAAMSAPSSAARGKKRARMACAAGRSCLHQEVHVGSHSRVHHREEHVRHHDQALSSVLDPHSNVAWGMSREVDK